MYQTNLPISDALSPLLSALKSHGRAVLQAPPGAGKTTVVPLAILQAGICTGRILMLEPRRLAARAAAARLAQSLGEPLGETVGYRMRGDSKTSAKTRIEVVTEGILTRMIQSDPTLDGIDAIIFDEFHERSLNADLGLALAWEIRGALREDLMILVMSATLDAAPVATLLNDAPMVTSEGRSFTVSPKWLDKPVPKTQRFENAVANLIAQAVSETSGGVLVFLPGEGEIRRIASLLDLPADCAVRPLYGAMPFKDQQAAIAPVTQGRKIVLATSIAETSLTIDDIRVVIDAGRSRRARFDPNSGMSKLVTEKVTKAEATQRMGRAGRVAEGICYKLWTKGEDGGLATFPPAEIEAADLTSLALELALWGAQASDLTFLTSPPEGALDRAQGLLTDLGALKDGRLTDHGKDIAKLPLHPRLAHMIRRGGGQAPRVAALLSERDIARGTGCDLSTRLRMLNGDQSGPVNAGALKRIRQEAKRLDSYNGPDKGLSLGALAALAYPDRIGLRRDGDAARYILSGGKGALIDANDPLAKQRLIVATDLDGDTREAKVRQAATISEAELRALFGNQITWVNQCEWSKRDRRVVTRQQERLGALALQTRKWSGADPMDTAAAMCDGIRDLGLRFTKKADLLRARVALIRACDGSFPDLSSEALLDTIDDWLLPYLSDVITAEQWKTFDCFSALEAMLTWEQKAKLDQEVPSHFKSPMGRSVPIDYSGDAPRIEVRLQEMFGTTRHPTVAGRPLSVTLLSPAQRPLQTTMDIPGFWVSSYADVRKDMRGRYPKHPWPEDPTQADPTLRAKPRGK